MRVSFVCHLLVIRRWVRVGRGGATTTRHCRVTVGCSGLGSEPENGAADRIGEYDEPSFWSGLSGAVTAAKTLASERISSFVLVIVNGRGNCYPAASDRRS